MTAERADYDAGGKLYEYCVTRDKALRNELVEHYLYLARSVARRFSGRGVDYDDLMQVASLALIGALERYDCAKGVQFITFAAPTLAGETRKYFRDKARVVRLPRRGVERFAKIQHARHALREQFGREPSVTEIAELLKISQDDVLDTLEMSRASNIISLSAPSQVGADTDEDMPVLEDMLEEAEPGYRRVESLDMIERALGRLPQQERKVLDLRMAGGKSQREVAKEIGASQMHISRMEHRILEKLRADIGPSLRDD